MDDRMEGDDAEPGVVTDVPSTDLTSREVIEMLREDKRQMHITITNLQEEVRRLREAIEGKSSATTITPTQTAPQPPPPPPASRPQPENKRRKLINSNTKTSSYTTTNPFPLPLFNKFASLAQITEDTEFPPMPTTSNDPNTPLPTKSTRTTARPVAQPTPPAPKAPSPTATPMLTPATYSTSAPTPSATESIPPIILHDKDSWVRVSTAFNLHKFQYSRATNTREGIRVTPATIADYRNINSFLTKENLSFHTFQLPSEKTIKVVIRGVPQSLSHEQIITDLNRQNYIPLFVTRLNGRSDRPAPLILVQVERKFQSIFNLKTLCGLDVTVEAKRLPPTPLQCHRCQRFGHAQPNCNAPYRCMKCAEDHSTHLCTKPTTTPVVCANCNASHISTHHTCPQTFAKPTPVH